MRVGKELAPEYVNFCPVFKAPQLHYLLMWSGGTSLDECRVLSCPGYERMNTDTAFKMCAAGGKFMRVRGAMSYRSLSLQN